MFRPSDVLQVLFSLVWGGFMVFWVFDVGAEGTPFFSRPWETLLLLFVLNVVAGRFVWDSWLRAHTVNGLTDHRVLIISSSPWRRVVSVPLNTLTDLTLSPKGDGGTITFGPAAPLSWWSDWAGAGTKQSPVLELASGVHRVYEMVVSAQSKVQLTREPHEAVVGGPAAEDAPVDDDSFDNW